MKTIATITPTDLVTNFLLSSFCSFLQTKNKNQDFTKLVVWYQEIFLFFGYSESRSTSKPCQIQQTIMEEFSYMLFVFALQFHGVTNFRVGVLLTPPPIHEHPRKGPSWIGLTLLRMARLHMSTQHAKHVSTKAPKHARARWHVST